MIQPNSAPTARPSRVGAKVIFTLLAVLTVILLPDWHQLTLNVVLLLSAAGFIGILKPLIKRLLPFVYLSCVMILLHSLFNPANTDFVYIFGIQGFIYGLKVSLRLLCIVILANGLLLSTKLTALIRWFGWLHADLGLIFGLVLSILPAMRLQMVTTMEVQAARGMKRGRGLWSKLSAYLSIIVPIVIKSLLRARTMAELLYLRGYGQQAPKRQLVLDKVDVLYVAGGVLFLALNLLIARVLF